jgi:hypothetical protein
MDNIVAALERSSRVNKIELHDINGLSLEKVLAAMQEPFPELTDLMLWSNDETVSVLPNSFLGGGSAPHLQLLWLDRIPFPGLPKLLMSATHLVDRNLWSIPHSGYISPEAMVAAISTSTSLEQLWLSFQSPRSFPDRHSPPPTRSIIPVLTSLRFKGVREYLDALVAFIDVPRLKYLYATFFNQIVFDTPQFSQFISRSPTMKALGKARFVFEDGAVRVNISSQTSVTGHQELTVKTPCRELDWQVSSLEQVCTSSLPPLSTLEDLYIYQSPYSHPHWQDNIEDTLRLELLRPFTAVKNLYLCATYRACPARAFWGQNGRSVAHLTKHFLGGTPTIGSCRERHWAVYCHATSH